MMNARQIKFNRLTVFLALVAIFVFLATWIAVKTVVDVRDTDRESLVSKEVTRKKEPALASELKLPRIKDLDDEEYLEEKLITEQTPEESEPEEVELEDLPVEKLTLEEMQKLEDLEEELPGLNTEPSPEELKKLQQKGTIIF